MKATIILTILIFSHTFFYGQPKASKFDFEIIFAAYFHDDLIDLKINGETLAKGKKLKSGTNGAMNFRIYQTRNDLVIVHNGSETRMKRVSTNPRLKLEISLNNNWHSYDFDLRNGKILVVKYENPHGSKKMLFSVEQGNEYPLFL